MNLSASSPPAAPALPDHTQLPDEDGDFVKNFQEPDQGDLLTDSLYPVLNRLHPDGMFAIGRDSGIYWRNTDPPLAGCKAPDWFYVPGVPPMLDGQFRRSYVLWQERVAPEVAIEFASGDGREERDTTPESGKFWVYERGIRIPFYGVFEFETGRLTCYQLVQGRYQLLQPNDQGRYFIPALGVEIGVWFGTYRKQEALWLRWFDTHGNVLPTSEEMVAEERQLVAEVKQQAEEAKQQATEAKQQATEAKQQATEAKQQAEEAKQRAEQLAARLRALGVDPDKT